MECKFGIAYRSFPFVWSIVRILRFDPRRGFSPNFTQITLNFCRYTLGLHIPSFFFSGENDAEEEETGGMLARARNRDSKWSSGPKIRLLVQASSAPLH